MNSIDPKLQFTFLMTVLLFVFTFSYLSLSNSLREENSTLARATQTSTSQLASPAAAAFEDLLKIRGQRIITKPAGQGVIAGELLTIINDKMEPDDDPSRGHRHETEYYIRDFSTQRLYEVKEGATDLPEAIPSGSLVLARGWLNSNTIELGPSATEEDQFVVFQEAERGPVLEERKLLVIPGNYSNKNLKCSTEQITKTVFGNSPDSVAGAFAEASNGNLTFVGEVTPTFSIDFTADKSFGPGSWGVALRDAATAAGYNLDEYDHILHVLPSFSGSGGGYGQVVGSLAWVHFCDRPGIYMHELGHNLGLRHAMVGNDQYGDDTSVMGWPYFKWREFHAANKENLGWIPESLVLDAPQGEFQLSPIDIDPRDATAAQVARFPKSDTGDYYYVSFRSGEGISSALPAPYNDTVHIHRWREMSVETDFLLPTLGVGDSFTDDANGLNLTVLSISNNVATISTNSSCVTAAPSVSVTPSNNESVGPSEKRYKVTVKSNNSNSCGSQAFALDVGAPAGWTVRDTFGQQQLSAGEVVTKSVYITPNEEVDPGVYDLTFTSGDGFAEASYVVTAPAEASDIPATVSTNGCDVAPTLKIDRPNQSTSDGARRYKITLRNNNSVECPVMNYSVDVEAPQGWIVDNRFDSRPIPPDGSRTRKVWITPNPKTLPGVYSIVFSSVGSSVVGTLTWGGHSEDTDEESEAAVANESTDTTTNTVDNSSESESSQTDTAVACTERPTISISPQEHTAGRVVFRKFQVTVQNNNDRTCDSTEYTLDVETPDGWTVENSFGSVAIEPEESVTRGVRVTPSADAGFNTYDIIFSTEGARVTGTVKTSI